MALGQYSDHGGSRHTKDTLAAAAAAAGYEVTWARKAGHNRLHFKTADGRQGFVLHSTVIAEVSPDGQRLTLRDGGWATMTTRAAWRDALTAFGVPMFWTHGAMPLGSHAGGGGHWDRKAVFARTLDGWQMAEADAAPPMLRADVDGSGAGPDGNLEVTYTDGEVRSQGAPAIRIRPARLILSCRDILERVKAYKRAGRVTRWGEADYDYAFPLLGYDAAPGSFGRFLYVGCHRFKVSDIRAVLRRLEAIYPEDAKRATATAREIKARQRAKAATVAHAIAA